MNHNLSTTATVKHFGRYRPLAVLGRGGMANVYLAASSGPGNFTKLVVIKELKPDLADDAEYRAMFLEEARLAARLHHPNVVQTFEVLETTEQYAFVMEYLDGQPMNRLRTRLSLPYSRSLGIQLRIVAEMLAGLHYAHELQDYDGKPLRLVHRDVSPHNIFITYAGEVKVVDFGIAKSSDSSTKTKAGVIKGKLTYMAPEQALGHPIDRRADIFSAGLILWEAAAGRRIWKGMQDGAILNLLATGELPKLEVAAPEVPRELVVICKRAMEPAKADRYATAAEFLLDLERVMRQLPWCPATRELGAFVSEVFQDDREKIREVIEEQMRVHKTMPESAVLPKTLPHLAASTVVTPSDLAGEMVSDPPPPLPSASGRSARTGPQTAMRPNRILAVIAGLGATASFFTALFLIWQVAQAKKNVPPTSTGVATTNSSTLLVGSASASAEPQNVIPKAVGLTLMISPKTAHATLDGLPLMAPGPTLLVPTTEPRVLIVEAAGYQAREVSLVIEADQTVTIDLEKLAAPPVTQVRPHGATKSDADPDLGF